MSLSLKNLIEARFIMFSLIFGEVCTIDHTHLKPIKTFQYTLQQKLRNTSQKHNIKQFKVFCTSNRQEDEGNQNICAHFNHELPKLR